MFNVDRLLAELKQAGQDFGLNAVSVSRLIPEDLKSMTELAILHVKSDLEQKDYNHFVLYLGSKDGKAMIFNPPAEKSLVEFGSLTPKWDGNALVISSQPVALSKIYAPSQKRMIIYAGMMVLVIAVFHGVKRLMPLQLSKRLQLFLTAGQAGGFIFIAVFAGLLCHYFYDGGFFSNAPAVEGMQKAYAGSFISKITLGRMQQVAAQNNAVILDARLKRDYDTGHIEKAVSLPINCTDDEYQQTVSSLPKDRYIVLYCQSAGCPFAEKIALRLKAEGFKNLAVFKGGWVEWQKANTTQSAKVESQKDEKSVK